MTRIILVRHGETEWNASARVQGHTDVPLSASGRRQAELAAQALSQEPISAVLSSDLARALETAQILAMPHQLSVQQTPDLRERAYGVWEGKTIDELAVTYPDLIARLRGGEWVTPDGAEEFEAFQNRVVSAIDTFVAGHEGETVLVASHGGPVKTFVGWVLSVPLEARGAMRTGNAAYSVILKRGARYILESYNVTSHLAGFAAPPTPTPAPQTAEGRAAIETSF